MTSPDHVGGGAFQPPILLPHESRPRWRQADAVLGVYVLESLLSPPASALAEQKSCPNCSFAVPLRSTLEYPFRFGVSTLIFRFLRCPNYHCPVCGMDSSPPLDQREFIGLSMEYALTWLEDNEIAVIDQDVVKAMVGYLDICQDLYARSVQAGNPT